METYTCYFAYGMVSALAHARKHGGRVLGIRLGGNWPHPVVDHAERLVTLERFGRATGPG